MSMKKENKNLKRGKKQQINKKRNSNEPRVLEFNLSKSILVLLLIGVVIGVITTARIIITINEAKQNKALATEEGKNSERVNWVTSSDGIQVPVPKGYVASQIPGETSVNGGFVIYEDTAEGINWDTILGMAASTLSLEKNTNINGEVNDKEGTTKSEQVNKREETKIDDRVTNTKTESTTESTTEKKEEELKTEEIPKTEKVEQINKTESTNKVNVPKKTNNKTENTTNTTTEKTNNENLNINEAKTKEEVKATEKLDEISQKTEETQKVEEKTEAKETQKTIEKENTEQTTKAIKTESTKETQDETTTNNLDTKNNVNTEKITNNDEKTNKKETINEEVVTKTEEVKTPEEEIVMDKELQAENTGIEAMAEDTSVNIFNLQKSTNQYVWVPVNDISRIYGVDSNRKLWGKLYNVNDTGRSNNNWTETNGLINITSKTGNREPDVIHYNTDCDIDSKLQSYLYGETQYELLSEELEKYFCKTIDSIKKYGGFYIGRYETGGLNGTAVIRKMDTDISGVTWYEMYKKCKTLKGENGNVITSMIWGSLWDETLQWLVESEAKNSEGTTLTYSLVGSDSTTWGNYSNSTFSYIPVESETGETTSTGGGYEIPAGSSEYTKTNNIYDLAGNVYDWTLEAETTYYRVCRGGCIINDGKYYSAGRRGNSSGSSFPNNYNTYVRLQSSIVR